MFFFSSRRRHTRCGRDWSSDVCSSDLIYFLSDYDDYEREGERSTSSYVRFSDYIRLILRLFIVINIETVVSKTAVFRSEERRVGKECRSRWSGYQYSKKKYRMK